MDEAGNGAGDGECLHAGEQGRRRPSGGHQRTWDAGDCLEGPFRGEGRSLGAISSGGQTTWANHRPRQPLQPPLVVGPTHQPGPEPSDQHAAVAVISEGLQQQVQGEVVNHRWAAAPLSVPGGGQRGISSCKSRRMDP